MELLSSITGRGIVMAVLVCALNMTAAKADENTPGSETGSPESTTLLLKHA